MRIRYVLIALLLVLILGGPPAIFMGSMSHIESQRIADAEPAFEPILHLGCRIWSQPIAFYRHCRYVVEFPPESKLTDLNIGELKSLNLLPSKNTLDVTIHTPNVTDKSLSDLKAINTFDVLAVTDTSISDEGIEELRRIHANAIVPTRTTK